MSKKKLIPIPDGGGGGGATPEVGEEVRETRAMRNARRQKKAIEGIPVAVVVGWIEFGTDVRRTDGGANRGQIKANPFMSRAWERTKDQALQTIISGIQDALKG
jgi:hypothetical protein